MADIFAEVEEDVRRENFKKLWDRYGKYVSIGAIVLVAVVGGFTWWKQDNERRAEAASAQFFAAQTLARDGKADEALAGFETVAAQAPPGYRSLASLQAAAVKKSKGDVDGAIAIYDALTANGDADPLFRDYAALLAARLVVDKGDAAGVERRLAPLTGGTNVWRHLAAEMLAAAKLQAGDAAGARTAFQRLADDATASAGVRARAAELLAALGPA